jgi:putative MFS transporter
MASDEEPLLPSSPLPLRESSTLTPWSRLESIINYASFGWTQYKLVGLSFCVNFAEAMSLSLLPILFPILKKQWDLTNAELAFLGSSTAAGMLLGCLLLGKSSDYIGRRRAIFVGLMCVFCFGLGLALSPNLMTMVLLNGGVGFGYGGVVLVANSFLTECLPTNVRGIVLTSVSLGFGIGGVATLSSAAFVIPLVGWRWMVSFQNCFPFFSISFFSLSVSYTISSFLVSFAQVAAGVIPTIPALVFLFCVPESPRFLLLNGRVKETVEALQRICTDNNMILPASIAPSVDNMTEKIKKTCTNDSSSDKFTTADSVNNDGDVVSAFLPSPKIRSTLLPLLSVWLFNAFAGTVFGWMPLFISENTDLASTPKELMAYAYTAALLMSVGDMLGTFFVAGMFSMNVGRRILMFGMLCCSSACLVGLAFWKEASAIMIVLLLAKTMAGITNALYVYTPEVFPTSFRVTGMVMCSSVHRFAPIAAPFAISSLMDNLSFIHVACTFAGLYLMAALSTLLLPIETRGRAIVEDHVGSSLVGPKEEDGILLLAPCRAVYMYDQNTTSSKPPKRGNAV